MVDTSERNGNTSVSQKKCQNKDKGESKKARNSNYTDDHGPSRYVAVLGTNEGNTRRRSRMELSEKRALGNGEPTGEGIAGVG